MKTFSDVEIEAVITPEFARSAMREALIAAWEGRLIAPPRAAVDLDDRRMMFTCGALRGDWFGYRSYIAPGASGDDQLVVVQDQPSGRVRGIAAGQALGPRRVGGIGGVALDALGPASAQKIALLGTGIQAWHQLWALPDRFRRNARIHVYSRSQASREAFAEQCHERLDLPVTAAESAAEAADDADVVILATSSPVPVLRGNQIKPGAYVASLGPKQVGRSEFDLSLVAAAVAVISDSPAQVRAYDPPNVLVGTGIEDDLVHLGAVLAGDATPSDGTRVFFSVGLAGTEAWLLNAALAKSLP